MHQYIWETPEEINMKIAANLRRIRKRLGISQAKLSELSGVSYGSVKRFESSGQISFLSLTKLAIALGTVDEIKALFENTPYRTIEEVINEQK